MNQYKYFVFAHPEDKGKHYNTIPTVLHTTTIAAENEAKRLARLEPNIRFCVGVLYKHFMNTPSPTITEVSYGYQDFR